MTGPRARRLRAALTDERLSGPKAVTSDKEVVTPHTTERATDQFHLARSERSLKCYTLFVSRTIAQRELRNDNARVIDEVASGQTFVVTRHGIPVAELRPVQQPRRTFVPRAELKSLAAAGPQLGAAKFKSDIDRIVDQSL